MSAERYYELVVMLKLFDLDAGNLYPRTLMLSPARLKAGIYQDELENAYDPRQVFEAIGGLLGARIYDHIPEEDKARYGAPPSVSSPYDLLTEEESKRLKDDLERMAKQRRDAEVAARNLPIGGSSRTHGQPDNAEDHDA